MLHPYRVEVSTPTLATRYVQWGLNAEHARSEVAARHGISADTVTVRPPEWTGDDAPIARVAGRLDP